MGQFHKTISAKKLNMKTKRNKDYYLRRAIRGFKILIIYQCVTKPQFDPAYRVNGKFSKDKMFDEVNFFHRWAKMGERERCRNAKLYAKYSKHHNLSFGLDCRLVEKVLGCYRNDEGKQERIHFGEVVQKLHDDGWLDWNEHGTKTKKNEHGEAEVVCWWKRKYFIKNMDYWLKLLADPRYSDYTQYPLDDEGFVLRAIKIIAKYRKQTIHKRYSSLKELFTDFMNGNIEVGIFRTLAVKQFNQSETSIENTIMKKEKNSENEKRTHYQDKQGQEVLDETPSPTEDSDNSTPSGQGEKPICLDGLVQETQGLQKKTN